MIGWCSECCDRSKSTVICDYKIKSPRITNCCCIQLHRIRNASKCDKLQNKDPSLHKKGMNITGHHWIKDQQKKNYDNTLDYPCWCKSMKIKSFW